MTIKKMIKNLSYNDGSFRLKIFIRVFLMLLRGCLYKMYSRSTIEFPFFKAAGCSVLGPGRKLSIGKYCKFERNTIIQTSSIKGVRIGNNVTIGEGTQIRPSGYYGGELGEGLILGDGVAIGVNSYIGCSGEIVIGDNVIIGPHFTAIAENHNFDDKNIAIKDQGVKRESINIANNVWIGCNVTILAGVSIGERTVIAAGAVVTKSFPANSVIGGVPAKLIRTL